MSKLHVKSRNSFLKDYALHDSELDRTRSKRKRALNKVRKNQRKELTHELVSDTNSETNSETNSACTPRKVLDTKPTQTVTSDAKDTERQSCVQVNLNNLIIKNDNKMNKLQINVPTNNSFKPLENVNEAEDVTEMDADENDQDAQQPNHEEQQRQQTQKPPPPIVIHGTTNKHTDLTRSITQCTSDNYNIKYTHKNINITFTNRTERTKYMNTLIEQKIDFHTYTDTTEKTHAFVIRGLTDDITATDIAEDLKQAHGIPVTNCYKMSLKNYAGTTSTKALFLLVTKNNITLKSLSTIKYALHTRIYFERRRNSRRITQCHNCQAWGHATSNCHASPKCMFCAGNHATRTCEDKTKPKCANCGQTHQANDTECSEYTKKLEWLDKQRRPQQQNQSNYEHNDEEYPAIYKPAPPPAQNAWKQRTTQQQQASQIPQQSQQQMTTRQQARTTSQQQHPTAPPQQPERQQHHRQQPPTYVGQPPTTYTRAADPINELAAQYDILHSMVNIEGLIQAVKDLNEQLQACNTKLEKFHTYAQFTKRINDYDI